MKKRNLSEFMCIEMLYDYKSGKLDSLRQQAVEEGLQASPRVREELRKLSVGISYTDKLRATTVTQPLVDYVMNQPKSTEKFFSRFKWQAFPQPVRWALEAVLVAVAISLFVTQMPELFKGHGKKDDSGFVVKKFDLKPTEPKEGVKTPETIKQAEATKAAEAAKDAAKTEPAKPVEAAKPEVVAAITPAPVPPPVPTKPLVIAPTPAPTTAPAQEVAKAPEAEKPKAKKGNAYLFRMVMQTNDVDKITPQVTDLIKNLGGDKAGEVELGWRRKGGSYFHFSLPKASNQAFQDGLKKLGVFSIIKSPHPRVMPEDTERFILWVEEKKAKGETPTQTAPDEGAGVTSPEENSEKPTAAPAEKSPQATPENTEPE